MHEEWNNETVTLIAEFKGINYRNWYLYTWHWYHHGGNPFLIQIYTKHYSITLSHKIFQNFDGGVGCEKRSHFSYTLKHFIRK